jgi:hypothetical protein
VGTVEAGVGADDGPAGVDEMESEVIVSMSLGKMEREKRLTLERRHCEVCSD